MNRSGLPARVCKLQLHHMIVALLMSMALLLAACSADDTPAVATSDDEDALGIAVASFDIAVGDNRRLLAGVYTATRELVAFGEVTFRLGFVAPDSGGDVTLDQQVTAAWLPVAGMAPDGDDTQPRLLAGEPGSGVYQARVQLDQPGTWALQVEAQLQNGTTRIGTAVFNVQPETLIPTIGDPAQSVDNWTIADAQAGRVDPVAVDSRAQGDDATIPAPHLHDVTVSEALDAGRPIVITIATPVYCVSRFCGPLTDVMAELALEYADVAEFIHIEVWENFDEQQLNEAAAAWIQTDLGGNEPWVFVVDGTGHIQARWDNVLDVDELERQLAQL
ncbi:MAG: hypothetical protein WD576_05070 [Nitriliruptoraceae bacterium]